jgi:hypothetical protein
VVVGFTESFLKIMNKNKCERCEFIKQMKIIYDNSLAIENLDVFIKLNQELKCCMLCIDKECVLDGLY